MKAAAGTSVVAIALFSVLSSVPAASPEPGGDRPSYVSADHWFPIGDNVGVVLIDGETLVSAPPSAIDLRGPRAEGRSLTMISPATGYLVVRKDGRWMRLHLAGAGAE